MKHFTTRQSLDDVDGEWTTDCRVDCVLKSADQIYYLWCGGSNWWRFCWLFAAAEAEWFFRKCPTRSAAIRLFPMNVSIELQNCVWKIVAQTVRLKVKVADRSALVTHSFRFFAVKLEDLQDLEEQDPEITPGKLMTLKRFKTFINCRFFRTIWRRSSDWQRFIFLFSRRFAMGRFSRETLAQSNDSLRNFTAVRAGRHDHDLNRNQNTQRNDVSEVC